MDIQKKNLKPITFTQAANKSGLVISREAKICGDYSEHGRSYYKVECPFCLCDFNAYKWSLRGGGKRCPNCLALMGSSFNVYQWAELVEVV